MSMKMIRPLDIVDDVLFSSNVTEDDYGAYDAGHTYATGDRVIVVATDVHKIFESLVNSNTGHTPVGGDGDTYWLYVSATNRWKMFDDSVTSQTSNDDSINCIFDATGRVDSVALLNIDAAEAHITMTDALEGVVFNRTINLVSDSGIDNWYDWFFEPIQRVVDFSITDMPPNANPTIEVTLSDSGNTVLCGACVLGQSKEIGITVSGVTIGVQDYSIKQRDAFGIYTILGRAFNKRANFEVIVNSKFVDQLQILLATYRATSIVYIGTITWSSTIIYGFYKDFSIEIIDPETSKLTMELEGLT